MSFQNITVGFALTGSFCTLAEVLPAVRAFAEAGAQVIPILSETTAQTDTRFGKAAYFIQELKEITGRAPLCSRVEAEPIGPKQLLDILVVAPCTGNTLSKLALGITDSSVTLACKAHLRNARPLLLAPSTNDALGATGANIGRLHNTKNVYFVPYGQDDAEKKATSMVADMRLILPAARAALNHSQLQPVIL